HGVAFVGCRRGGKAQRCRERDRNAYPRLDHERFLSPLAQRHGGTCASDTQVAELPPYSQRARGPPSTIWQCPHGLAWSMNLAGGASPHCEVSASSAATRFDPFARFKRSLSAQCSCTRPQGSAQ